LREAIISPQGCRFTHIGPLLVQLVGQILAEIGNSWSANFQRKNAVEST